MKTSKFQRILRLASASIFIPALALLVIQGCTEPAAVESGDSGAPAVQNSFTVSADGDVRASGVVQRVTRSSLDVADRSFVVSTQAKFSDEGGNDVSFSDVTAGSVVNLWGRQLEGGTLVVSSAEVSRRGTWRFRDGGDDDDDDGGSDGDDDDDGDRGDDDDDGDDDDCDDDDGTRGDDDDDGDDGESDDDDDGALAKVGDDGTDDDDDGSHGDDDDDGTCEPKVPECPCFNAEQLADPTIDWRNIVNSTPGQLSLIGVSGSETLDTGAVACVEGNVVGSGQLCPFCAFRVDGVLLTEYGQSTLPALTAEEAQACLDLIAAQVALEDPPLAEFGTEAMESLMEQR